ncbi:N-acetylmuramoyl-L-alanine amidase [Actinomadura sp. ATCC 31491]|uniref:N-acetylmuramoyl-L-alanine amidase n=1 Tax=Actinomadura luzonensis TaxID=2805427 RepID=A0ABT0G532_9ACTN|nr:N-acetylmuramoyl-L-alanine amidase [Actinomadura luzonensis]MCK2219685.1 N-acetylmuramoyl-L-alanine amidase [Actinomadura luzonensis]
MKFVQAAKHGGTQTGVKRIVIHATVSPCEVGGARNVARYFQSSSAGGSAHYIVDPGETVACVKETVVAFHAPPNTGSIGVELCDPQKGPSARWGDDEHEAMLRRAAALVRQIAARWEVPLKKLTVTQVKAGARGICGHVDVSRAFGQTDHSDPGTGFPWPYFMELVRGGTPVEDSWTEKLVKDLPTVGPKADSYDVKTIRGCLFARGRVPQALYSDAGLEAWLNRTAMDPELVELVREFQRAEGLGVDGWVGPNTWPALLRVT